MLSRQVAMYIASRIGGWSTSQIGRFYNGRDHSTVCYAIRRIGALREVDPEVDGLLTVLASEIRDRAPSWVEPKTRPRIVYCAPTAVSMPDEGVLEALVERIATRVLSKLNGRLDSNEVKALGCDGLKP